MATDLRPRAVLGEEGDSTVADVGRRLRRLSAKAALVAPSMLALAATAWFLWLFLRIQWRIGDEGSIVYGAARVAEGAVPYRDFFEVMGPGTFYWLALWFRALGTSWLTSRVAVLVTALVASSAIAYATTRQCRGRWALVPAAIYTVVAVPLWPGTNHHFDGNMWALLAFAVNVSVPRFRWTTLMLTGLLAGLASTVMPQKGVLVLAGLCIARLIDGARLREWRCAVVDTLWMVGAFLLVGVAVLALFWSRDALPELIYANLIWPATRYHSVNIVPYAHNLREFAFERFAPVFAAVLPSPLSAVAGALVTVPFVLIAVLPFVAAMSFLHGVMKRRREVPRAAGIPPGYWCAGFALFASECHRPDMSHLIYASPILLIAVVLWLGRVSGRLAVVTRLTLVAGTTLLAALLALMGTAPETISMKTRSGEIRLLKPDDALTFLHEALKPGEQVFVYPYYPMYYFLADVRNPTRYSILMYHINAPAQFDEVIRDLEANQVRYVLWDTMVAGGNLTRWFPGYRDPPADEQILERYLNDHYRVIGVKNQFRILQRM